MPVHVPDHCTSQRARKCCALCEVDARPQPRALPKALKRAAAAGTCELRAGTAHVSTPHRCRCPPHTCRASPCFRSPSKMITCLQIALMCNIAADMQRASRSRSCPEFVSRRSDGDNVVSWTNLNRAWLIRNLHCSRCALLETVCA